ncbi:hypothetical protein [Mycobacterium sp. NPDC050853]|uniref:hypothetical protein n=1 Tax=Mycobacterium sp. NPDC050853 TaxID=3155160 RepID=UPI0033C45B09
MEREIAFPVHLAISAEAVNRLRNHGWSTDEVLIAGLSDLESFVRTRPNDAPFIDAGPLEPYPITKMVINGFEAAAVRTSGEVSYGAAAIERIGYVVAAVKGLEVLVQQLTSRIEALERS